MAAANTRVVVRTVAIVVIAAITLYVVFLLRKPIGWIIIAAFIAVALSGPVNLLQRRMRRGFAIALVYLGLILTPFLLVAVIVPPVISEVDNLVAELPGYVADVQRFVNENDRLQQIEQDYQIVDKIRERAEELPSRVGDAAAVLGGLGLGIVNSVFALLTILILSAFLVSSGPRWTRALIALQPPEHRERLARALADMTSAVGNYVGGALLQATIAGVLTFVVLSILGMPFAAPLALVVALFDLIPLVGATLAAVLVGIVTLFNDFPTTTLIWVVWSIIYQQLENNLIQPQIQRRAVDVHPFVVLTAVLFGSTLFGVLGALLAIPAAASVQIAVKEWWLWRREGAAGQTGTPGERAGTPPAPPPAPPAPASS